MVLADILFAVATALVLTGVSVGALRRVGPFRSVWPFFVLVLLAAWLAGMLINGLMPLSWALYWVPFVAGGMIVAIVLAAIANPYVKPPVQDETDAALQPADETERRRNAAVLVAGSYLWFAVLGIVLLLLTVFLVR